MIDKTRIIEIIEPQLAADGAFLVDIKVSGDNHIGVDIDSEKGVSIDYCVLISKLIESHFDREVEDYSLEVASAGIGLPFKVLRQYLKHIGNDVEVKAKNGMKYIGTLKSADSEGFTVEIEELVKPEGAKRKQLVAKDITFEYSLVKSVSLVINF